MIGAQKSGTSALDTFLRSHPQLGFASSKELHFFDADRLFDRQPNYAAYHAHFEPDGGAALYGETTPNYLYWPPCAARIHAYNPGMRLIALLRNPVERAHSHWAMDRQRGYDRLPFPLAIRAELLGRRTVRRSYRKYAYIARGLYAPQLERFLALFPREQLLVLRNSDLRERHQDTLDRVTDFLGVDRLHGVAQETIFSHARAEMAPGDRRLLQRVFQDSNAELEGLLGWNLGDWR